MRAIPAARRRRRFSSAGANSARNSSRCSRTSTGARWANSPAVKSASLPNPDPARRMGKVTGFLEYERLEEPHEDKNSRKKHYREIYLRLPDEDAKIQGARCMDCGIPFCMQGCPVNNIIPDFNDLVYRQDWQRAIETLHSTNNFPEFTGRICPAPCEEACVLRINEDPVGIKSIEHAIIDKAWESGWVKPQPAAHGTGKRVAIVGSGPAGLACAQQLARAGHH